MGREPVPVHISHLRLKENNMSKIKQLVPEDVNQFDELDYEAQDAKEV